MGDARRFIGTAETEVRIAEVLGCPEDDVPEMMAEANIELCPECETWCEAGDLVDDCGEAGECSGCRTHH